MVRAVGFAAAVLVIIRGDIDFAADDRLYAVGCGLVIEIRGGEKIAMIGDGYSRHPAAGSLGCQFADLAGTVEKRIIRVEMKMNEVRRSHAKTILNQLRKIGYGQSSARSRVTGGPNYMAVPRRREFQATVASEWCSH